MKKQREGEREREREEKELGQLVIHYRLPIIHSGPSRLVLLSSLLSYSIFLRAGPVSRQKTHCAVF